MKNLVGIVVGLSLIFSVVSCGAEEKEERNAVPAGMDQASPEYKAYNLVLNLDLVKEYKEYVESKKQSISLKLSKERLNGKNGFYWFQVIQHVGASQIVKMNIKVREDSFKITVMDEDTGFDLTPEEYQKKFPFK